MPAVDLGQVINSVYDPNYNAMRMFNYQKNYEQSENKQAADAFQPTPNIDPNSEQGQAEAMIKSGNPILVKNGLDILAKTRTNTAKDAEYFGQNPSALVALHNQKMAENTDLDKPLSADDAAKLNVPLGTSMRDAARTGATNVVNPVAEKSAATLQASNAYDNYLKYFNESSKNTSFVNKLLHLNPITGLAADNPVIQRSLYKSAAHIPGTAANEEDEQARAALSTIVGQAFGNAPKEIRDSKVEELLPLMPRSYDDEKTKQWKDQNMRQALQTADITHVLPQNNTAKVEAQPSAKAEKVSGPDPATIRAAQQQLRGGASAIELNGYKFYVKDGRIKASKVGESKI